MAPDSSFSMLSATARVDPIRRALVRSREIVVGIGPGPGLESSTRVVLPEWFKALFGSRARTHASD